ncbi:hypothetical protein [Streptomyces sp. NPDC127108]|uniref:hypothetical protein n=1 Tax=Streptomyces sp. NPDC127108 TaxID=3345361 RepID=UPI0036330484
MFSRRGNRDEDGERGTAHVGGGYADAALPDVLARLDALTAAVGDLGDDVERHEEDIRDLLASERPGTTDVLDEPRRRALDVADDLQHVWLRAWHAGTEDDRGTREKAWEVGELIRRVLGVGGVVGMSGAPGAPGADGGAWAAAAVALRAATAEAGVEFSWDPVSLGRADGQSGAGAEVDAGLGTRAGAGLGTRAGAVVDCELWPGCVAWDPVLFVVRPAVVHRGQRVAPPMVFTGAVVPDGAGSGGGWGAAGVRGGGLSGRGLPDGGLSGVRGGELAGVRGREPSVVRGRGRWAWRVRGHRERRGLGGVG